MSTQSKESQSPEGNPNNSWSKNEERTMRSIAYSALNTAGYFAGSVDFANRFSLDEERTKLFCCFFAHYLTLKDGARLHYAAQNPLWNAIYKFDRKDMLFQETARRLLSDAEKFSKGIADSEKAFGKTFVKTFIQENPEIKTVFPDGPESEKFNDAIEKTSGIVTGQYGSPSSLRNAANVLSNEFMRWGYDRSKNKPPLAVAMQGPLAVVKLY